MRKIVLLTFMLLCAVRLLAQPVFDNSEFIQIMEKNYSEGLFSNEEFFTKATLVVEGRFLKTFASYDAKGEFDPKDFYTVQTILVQQVYKGDARLVGDTIYIARNKGRLYIEKEGEMVTMIPPRSTAIDLSDHGVFIEGELAVFFFVASDYPENPTVSEYSSKYKYKFLQDRARGVLEYWSDKFDYASTNGCKISGLNKLVFNNRGELYNYMKQFEGYRLPAPQVPAAMPQKWIKGSDVVIDSAQYEIIKAKWDSGEKKKQQTKAIPNTLTLTNLVQTKKLVLQR